MHYIELSHIVYALLIFSAAVIIYANVLQRKYYAILKWRDSLENILVRAVTTDEIYAIDVDVIEGEDEDDFDDEFSGGSKRNRYKAYIISERAFNKSAVPKRSSTERTEESEQEVASTNTKGENQQ